MDDFYDSATITNEHDKDRTPSSASKTPLRLNDHHFNFWAFLGYCQKLDVPLLPMSWHTGLGELGHGGQGQVHESFQRPAFGWAYKRLKPSRMLREMQQLSTPYPQRQVLRELRGMYRTIIAEIKALTKPELRECPYVVDLEGVTWEMLLPEIFIPVLVFQRSPIGSLKEVIISAQRSKPTFATRLKLCRDIALGLHWLHVNGIIHGDISPDNVLVFESPGRANDYHARISDFGCSTCIASPDEKIKVAVKYPWTAPEVHHRGLTIPEASRSDIYSLTLLALWALFSEELAKSNFETRLDHEVPVPLPNHGNGIFQYESAMSSIGRAKASGCLDSVADGLVNEKVALATTAKTALREFFHKNLSTDVKTRAQDMGTFLLDLNIDMEQESWLMERSVSVKDGFPMGENDAIRQRDHLYNFHPGFQLSASLGDLLSYPDIRFHSSFIAQCSMIYTESERECEMCSLYIALAMAVAYSLGFGAPKNSDLAVTWAEKEGIPLEVLSANIELLKTSGRSQPSLRNRELVIDFNIGYINAPIPRTLQEIEVIAKGLEQEAADIASVLGYHHYLPRILIERIVFLMRHNAHSSPALNDLVNRIYNAQDIRWMKEIDAVQEIFTDPLSTDVHNVIRVLKAGSVDQWRQRNFKAARELAILADRICRKIPIASSGPVRIPVLTMISVMYREIARDDWLRPQEAIARKVLSMVEGYHGSFNLEILEHLGTLCEILLIQDEYEEAEQLSERAYETARSILGLNHHVTFSSMNRHAQVLIARGKFDEAEYIIADFLYKAEAPRADNISFFHLVEKSLGLIYYQKGRYNEALQQLEASMDRFGSIDDVPVDEDIYEVLSTLLTINAKLKDVDEVECLLYKILAQRRGTAIVLRRVVRTNIDVGAALVEANIGLEDQGAEALLGNLITAAHSFGIASQDTLDNLKELALAYGKFQQWHFAEHMIRLLLRGSRLRDGKDWPKNSDNLRLIFQLACNVETQGRPTEAFNIMRAFEAKMAKYNHNIKAHETRYMAELHAIQGNYDRAEAMLRLAIIRGKVAIPHDDNGTQLQALSMGLLCFLYLARGKDSMAGSLKTRLLETLRFLTKQARLECIRLLVLRVVPLNGMHFPEPALSFLRMLIDFHVTTSGSIGLSTMELLTYVAMMKQINGSVPESAEDMSRVLNLIPDLDGDNFEKTSLRFRATSYMARLNILLGHRDEAQILGKLALEAEEALSAYENLEKYQDELPDDSQRGMPTSPSCLRVAWHHANVGDWTTAADLIDGYRGLDVSVTGIQCSFRKPEEIALDVAEVLVQVNQPGWQWVFRTQGFISIWEAKKRQHVETELSSWLSRVQKLCRMARLERDKAAKKFLSSDGCRKGSVIAQGGYRRGIARVRRRNGQPFLRKMYHDRKEMAHLVETFNRLSLASWRRTGWRGTWPRH
ncbi:hypothetical protein F5Y16DRAFT_381466 [Xylariaceae sp. FL0255]|nr:hypothetical protein F5Y16DRAFT_381466 [Xylariaceae sp. FL0255]